MEKKTSSKMENQLKEAYSNDFLPPTPTLQTTFSMLSVIAEF